MAAPGASRSGWRERLLAIIQARPAEIVPIGWAWLFYFSVLSAYYVIRPIRDDMGVESGIENLPWLFTGSLIGMLVLNPPFAWLVARWPRERFVRAAYHFFALNLVGFFVLLRTAGGSDAIWAGRVFFIWTSVFNMFVNAIFWSAVADVFKPEQGRRLFGFIAAGGTVGAIAGSWLTHSLVAMLGSANLLLVSAFLLEVAAFAALRLFRTSWDPRIAGGTSAPTHPPEVIGGSVWEGFARSVRSPFLLNVTFHMLFYTVLTTFLYFQQAEIVDQAFTDRTERTRFFASIDLAVNSLELATQVFATGRLLQTFGLAISLSFVPVLSVVGFAGLALSPTVAVLMAYQVLRRAANFAIARPSREVLFTVAPRTDRYKAKNFIDTFVYRVGDQLGAWLYAPLSAMGLGIPGISGVAIVLAGASVVNAVWLGRRAQAAERRGVEAARLSPLPS